MKVWKIIFPVFALASAGLAGPTLACHEWISTPGSAFAALETLRDAAMYTANHASEAGAARARIAVLRSEMRPDDPLTYLKAGYWITTLNSLGITQDADGPALVQQAAEMRPSDPEYQFFAALAWFDTDKARYRTYWSRAQHLAKPDTAVSRNLQNFEPVLRSREGSR